MKTRTAEAHRRADQARLARAAGQGRRRAAGRAAARCRRCACQVFGPGRPRIGDLRLSGTKGGPGRIPGRARGSARRDRPGDWQFVIVCSGRGDWGGP